MNQIIAVIAVLVAKLTRVRVADVEKAAVAALVDRLEKASDNAVDRANSLSGLAAEVAILANSERSYARDVAGLSGRLAEALHG